jgi:mycothiol synthase
MHLADRIDPAGAYVARPYRGPGDHESMTAVLAAYREHNGDPELPTLEQFDAGYAHLTGCDPDTDIAVIETTDGDVVAYARAERTDLGSGWRDCIVFAPTRPDHLTQAFFTTTIGALEGHVQPWAEMVDVARLRTHAVHPGPGKRSTGEAAWLEVLGYAATEWEASLVRSNLDDIAERTLPPGVEVRPVTPDQVRAIWEAHWEAFRDEWDFSEATDDDIDGVMAGPHHDPSLWKIAWAGDQIVGQVKSYINPEENAERGYRRGYTEYISTDRDWRNRGVAGALLAMSLSELKERGMTEAALGVDTNNPGGAFQLYTSLGFELRQYEAVYTKTIRTSAATRHSTDR